MTLTLPAQTLRAIAASLRQLSYVPTSWQGLLASLGADGRRQLEPVLVEMVREGAQPRLLALVLDRLADAQEARQGERDAWRFVWSGPEPLHSQTADTFATVDQLIREARSSLLIATFNIGLSSGFQAILASIAARLAAGNLQQVEVFFHPKQIENSLGSDPLIRIRHWFDHQVWPWPAKPIVYVDQRLLLRCQGTGIQHSKVVVADANTAHAQALVTSANFSEPAQRFNFEAGWLCKDVWRVQQISDHFQRLVENEIFVRI